VRVRLLIGLSAAVCLLGSWRMAVVASAAWLTREPTTPGVQAALRLTPDNSALRTMLGTLTAVSDPATSRAAFEQAVQLNPRNTEALINIGLEAEVRGDLHRAEAAFEAAMRVSRRFGPVWTHAGFAYRTAQEDQFWKSASAAANVEHAALTPVFALCARTKATPSQMLARLRLRSPGGLASFVAFAPGENDAEALGRAAVQLAAFRREQDAPLLFSTCERLIESGAGAAAVAVWNAIVRMGATRLKVLDATSGVVVSNPECEPGPLRAFDWRPGQAEGVAVARGPAGGGFRIELTGQQPPSVRLAELPMAVLPSTEYQVRVVQSAPQATAGLRWRVVEVPSGMDLAHDAPELSAQPEHTLHFTSGRDTRLARLVLEYVRAQGTTRLADSLLLKSVRVSRKSS
jgi:hypothetical protein